VSIDLSLLTAAAQACEARSEEIDELRRLPADLASELIGTGVMKVWVPKAYGGRAGSVMDLVNAVEHISYFNGSAGWCAMIGGTTGLNAGFLDPIHGEALFASPGACGGGLAAPAGVATITEGGLRVSGEWAWGSGTSHCTTIAGGVRIVDEAGERAELPGGSAGCFAFFDLEDVELLDTWKTSGLRGTGSTNYRVTDAFVPRGRWVALAEPASPVDDNPLYRFSAFGALAMGVTAVLMGLGRRAVDELIALGDKRGAGSKRTLAERAVVQSELARADAAVRSSRAFVESVVGECWEAASQGSITDEHRALLRLAATDVTARCKTAVDLCYHAAGGTSVYKTNTLERVFRDAHVATQHAMVAERVLEPLGRMRFGLPTSTSQF
jgi:alkylation response protein AidB-like acyl-CoA dehydrogenase